MVTLDYMRHRLTRLAITILCVIISGVMEQGVLAQNPAEWTRPMAPFHIIDNVYYVGSKGLASYLITTADGHILINSSLKESVPLIRQSVETLGFKFADIKILLISHAHWDHCAGSAEVLRQTGARYMVMDGDVPVIESGGKADFQYGGSASTYFPPATVNRILHDRDQVKLGATVLVAHKTAGHTKGCTTWSMKVTMGDKTYDAVILGSPNVNPGYKLVKNQAYPDIAKDYQNMFDRLKIIPCDVFLGAHGEYFDMEGKLSRMKQPGMVNPFLDSEGFRKYVLGKERSFQAELKRENQ